jgi:hypothetical protein
LAPRTTPIAYGAPDQERFTGISIDLEAIRQIIDRIAVTQEQITRNFDQLMGSQTQMMHEISKLQAAEHQNRGTNSEPLLAAAPSSARKPISPFSAESYANAFIWGVRTRGTRGNDRSS